MDVPNCKPLLCTEKAEIWWRISNVTFLLAYMSDFFFTIYKIFSYFMKTNCLQ